MIKWYRGVFRPGLLYFIRNSDDPDNLPLKEVVERSVPDQLLRFVNSLILFGAVIVCHFYGFSLMCQLFVPKLIPLNISFRNYTAEVPYDLFGNLFAKILVDFLNPGTIGKLSRAFMRSVLKLLRLSSYFYGGRYLGEESPNTGRWVFVPDAERVYKAEKVRDMFQKRVEPLDIAKIAIVDGRDPAATPIIPAVPIAEGRGPTVPVAPIEPRRSRRTGTGRRAEDSTKGFTVVYRPNNCTARVYLFLFTEWLYYQLVGMLLFATPILIGRYIFGLFLSDGTKAHEMHTFMTGFIVMGVLMKVVQLTYDALCDGGLANVLRTGVRVPIITFKAVTVGVFLAILWPTMIGAYLMLILSPLLSSVNETPILPVFTCWFIGFMYIKVFYTARDLLCSAERQQILDRLATLEGWTDMHFLQVMLRVVLPYTMRLVTLIVGPPLAVILLAPLIELDFVQMLIIGRWSYLLSLAVPAVVLGVGLISSLRESMAMRIRDDNYLVGRRLHNLERPGGLGPRNLV
jgi:E3 ubiquitin-protein ligase MARCH6